MDKHISVAKYEHSVLPGFRSKLSQAESTEDVNKFFGYTVRELLVNVFQDNQFHDFDAIELSDAGDPPYRLDKGRLAGKPIAPDFLKMWERSDLPRVIGGLAEAALHRRRHLAKNPEKTTAKIRN